MAKSDEKEVRKITARRELRGLAFHFLYAVDRFDYSVSLDQIVQNFKSGYNLQIPDDSLAIEMANGVIENKADLDAKIKPLLKNWKIERLGCCTLLILRLALWELIQKNAIPSIIINEAIELAKCFAEKDSYKFINGILDGIRKKLGLSEERKEEGRS